MLFKILSCTLSVSRVGNRTKDPIKDRLLCVISSQGKDIQLNNAIYPSARGIRLDQMTNKFRHPTNNIRFLKQLFFETTLADKEWVLYTLKDVDHNGYPSLYRLYMEADDVTEYVFANTYLDGWEHWQMLCECAWFKPYVARWRQELDLRMKARALAAIRSEARSGSRNAFAANKYLMERGWEPKDAKKLKDQQELIKAEADKISQEKDDLASAAERIGLTVVK